MVYSSMIGGWGLGGDFRLGDMEIAIDWCVGVRVSNLELEYIMSGHGDNITVCQNQKHTL